MFDILVEPFAPARRLANFQYAIRNVVAAAERLERAGRHITYLNIGDPQVYGFRPPAHVVEATARALRERFTGYSHSAGLWEARAAVAAYATGLGALTEPRDVYLTAGASEAADLLLSALVNEGDEALLPAPGYPIYPAILTKLGAVSRYYTLDGAHGWQPDPDEIEWLINERTRALVIINPNNPTGSIVSDATTRRLLEIAERNGLLVISDEVYRELCFDAPPAPASVLAGEMGMPLVTLESLSKTHLVPGWRVGWLRLTNGDALGDLMNAFLRLAGGRLCSPTPAQYAVKPALEGDQTFMREFLAALRRRRDYALRRAAGIPGLAAAAPAAAFYMMLRANNLRGRTDEQWVLDLLEATGLLVVHGSGFGADARDGYFRLVFLPDEDTLGFVFDEMERFLTSR
jgi:aspartate/methionine/tyrosine aminotransferase